MYGVDVLSFFASLRALREIAATAFIETLITWIPDHDPVVSGMTRGWVITMNNQAFLSASNTLSFVMGSWYRRMPTAS